MRVIAPHPVLSLLLAGTLFASAAVASEAVSIEVLDKDVQHTVIKYTLVDYESQPVTIAGQTWTSLSMHGEGFLKEVGSPQLPHVCRSVEIPDAAAMKVDVLASRYHDVPNVLIAPSKGPIPRTIDPDRIPFTFSPVYAQDAWYPAAPVAQRDPYILRDVRGMVVEANIFQYNPVQKVLRIYDELTVRVVPAGGAGKNPLNRSLVAAHPDRNFRAIYSQHFLNYVPTKALVPDGDMLIICYSPWLTNMQPLVTHKNAMGINTKLVDVATVGASTSAITAYINNLYNTSNLAFVLLVGDLAQIPSPSFAGGESDPTYSCISPDWYPDIFVGRFSATTAAHVDTQVKRTIAYESVSHDVSLGGWNAKGMGVASNQGPGHYNEYDNQHMDLIRGQFLAYGYSAVDQIYDPSANAAMVTAGLNDGRRTVCYCGHGSDTSWGTTGFSNTNVLALSNQGKLPVISAVACVNGNFSVTTCFAEAWLRAEKSGEPIGAAATYMSSINQYWDEPMYGQSCHKNGGKSAYVEQFIDETMTAVGALWFAGSCTMMDITGSSGRDMFMTWHVFGDPSLQVHDSASSYPGSVKTFGQGCAGTGTTPGGSCVSLNPNGGPSSATTYNAVYGYQVTTPVALNVSGFKLWTGAASSVVTNTALYLSAGSTPAAVPVATGLMSVGTTRQFYQTNLSQTVAIPAGSTFYIACNHAQTYRSTLTSGASGVAFALTSGWNPSTYVQYPSWQVICQATANAIPTLAISGSPAIGDTLTLDLTGARASAMAMLFTGGSDKNWGSLPLPLDLTPSGAPGCQVLVSLNIAVAFPSNASGAIKIPFALPNNPALVGLEFFQQFAVDDPTANGMGAAWSNAVSIKIGD